MKKIIQRNLSLDLHYRIDSVFHNNSLDSIQCMCDNCNRPIANVAVLLDEYDRKYHVGLDCAATLSNLDKFDLDRAVNTFNVAKQVRAKIQQYAKDYNIGNAKYLIEDVTFYDINNFYKQSGSGMLTHMVSYSTGHKTVLSFSQYDKQNWDVIQKYIQDLLIKYK